METMDTTAFEQAILKLGLVNEAQLAEVHEEIGEAPDLQHLISILERKGYMTPWQVGKVLKGDTDGYILGGYKLLYKIQSGSFGRVYRAVDPRDGRVVAVKVLRRRWSENEQRIEMFIREGKVGLMLKHPNIVEVLAINRDPSSGQYYIVMEFVEGGNLREILQIRKKLTVLESLRIIEDCANGLAYAYARGMTHRDIKLTNILLSDTGEAKLVDFGLAHFFSQMARKEDEKVDRTVDYAGLERATEVKTGDVRSDIYFLGCVLYECLTGRPPLEMTRDRHARMRKARFEQVRPIHPNEIDGPPSVLMLVETMMALDPKERYQTPSQLLDAVRKVRREVEGGSGNGDGQPLTRSVFLAEPDERLQDVLRDKLKEQGYRVFLAGDPTRALDRFHKQPFDGLIVDARTTGEEGFRVFEQIVNEAARRRLRCAALLLLGEDQTEWAERAPRGPHIGIMSEQITFKTVSRKLKELMEAAHDAKLLPALIRPTPAPPPVPTPLVVESPPHEEAVQPPLPTARIVEIPPREEATPQPPRHEPIPAALSPSPPPPPPPSRDKITPPPFVAFTVMTVDDVPLPTEEIVPPPRSEPPTAKVSAPPRDEIAPPPIRPESGSAAFSPSPPREETPPAPPRVEAAPSPPRREALAANAPSALPGHQEEDLPMLASDEDLPMLAHDENVPQSPLEADLSSSPLEDEEDLDLSLSPLEKDVPAASSRQEAPPSPSQREGAPPTSRRPEPIPTPRRPEPIPAPRRPEPIPTPRRPEPIPTPRPPEAVTPPRRVQPRRKVNTPQTTHVIHEDPLAPPDTHSWRRELGVPEEKKEGKENAWLRLWKAWTALSPVKKSLVGLSLLGLVVMIFFAVMISDMLIQRKFDKIKEDMTIEEVEQIMGGSGKAINTTPKSLLSKIDKKGRPKSAFEDPNSIVPETRMWEVGNKKIVIMFRKGVVVRKEITEK
jgi:tRNA A-37 threonylcarbamoyl transferase component Bud32/DNA-binding NarL/FixJ family response regulator